MGHHKEQPIPSSWAWAGARVSLEVEEPVTLHIYVIASSPPPRSNGTVDVDDVLVDGIHATLLIPPYD
jgi:hypothetical protein